MTTARATEGRDELANLAADVLMFALDDLDRPQVALIKRRNAPFRHFWAFPGGYVEEGEEFIDAAVREAEEETDVALPHHGLVPVGMYHAVGRDSRRRVVTAAYATFFAGSGPVLTALDDAKEVAWARLEAYRELGGLYVTVDEKLVTLAFDHDRILADAVAMLATAPGVSDVWRRTLWTLSRPGYEMPGGMRIG